MPRPKDDVEKALVKKGFIKKNGDHHYFVYHNLSGKKTAVFTKTSHTPKMREIPDNLISQMARQCRLDKQSFLNLVDCPLSQPEYEALVFKA